MSLTIPAPASAKNLYEREDMKVELEPSVWIADGDGDPPRTTKEESAKEFGSFREALRGLSLARKYRPFEDAVFKA